jgi:Sulfotransferase family
LSQPRPRDEHTAPFAPDGPVPAARNGIVRLAGHVRFCLADPAGLGHGYSYRERFNNAVFISPKRDFLFTKNEKCGNNTARMTLQGLAAGRPLPRNFSDTNRWFAPLLMPSDLGLRAIGDINRAIAFKFAIVRNPYTRLLSCYLNKFHTKKGRRDPLQRALKVGDEDLSFGDFVARVAEQSAWQMDPHWRIQHDNIFCDVIGYDRFVRFENLDEALGEILARFSTTPVIRNVRKGEFNAGRKVAEFYTPEIAAAVRRKFAIDFETFGYPDALPV